MTRKGLIRRKTKQLTNQLTNQLRLPYYFLITGRRRDGFMSFPRLLPRRETHTVQSRIWIRGGHSIFYGAITVALRMASEVECVESAYVLLCVGSIKLILHIKEHKEDLALNNLQWVICRKNQPNLIIYIYIYIYILKGFGIK